MAIATVRTSRWNRKVHSWSLFPVTGNILLTFCAIFSFDENLYDFSMIIHPCLFTFSFSIFFNCCPDQEPKWQVGYVYTPADAIAQGLKTLSLNETRELSRTISNWFRRFED